MPNNTHKKKQNSQKRTKKNRKKRAIEITPDPEDYPENL